MAAVAELGSQAMKKLIWQLVAIPAIVVPVMGLISGIVYRDVSIFYWSFAAAGVAAILFPLVFIGIRLIPWLLFSAVGSIVEFIVMGAQRTWKRRR